MKAIGLYRSDFKTLDGESMFDHMLELLGVPKDKWEEIESVDVIVESFVTSD